jgi:dienelactone hydrolase
MRACLILLLFTAGISPLSSRAYDTPDLSSTRLHGLHVGPHRVGFLSKALVDPTRNTSGTEAGTRIGVAVWYPAAAVPGAGPAMTGLDYRLLAFHQPASPAERRRFAEGEAEMAMGWRHVGIVPLDRTQASASLDAPGIAVRDATPAPRRYPVVMVLGGQYYLSTTAELLASHGFVVAAPFRFSDVSNEIGTASSTWYLENSVRDAEWAVDHLRTFEHADVSRLGAIGHGGGGLQALLYAMRNTNVTALITVDAGNFSARTHSQPIPFYSPRLLRIPYLYVATAETKKGQDRWEDFLGMRFSDRIDVTLQSPAIRHHDLSDLGRSVTAPMGIRGDAQPVVQQAYTHVQEMTVRFFSARASGRGTDQIADWLETTSQAKALSVAVHPGVRAAPTVEAVLASLDAGTAAALEDAMSRDPDAPVFRADALNRIITKALTAGQFGAAASIAEFAARLHPDSVLLMDAASEAREGAGDRAGAADLAARCAATPPGTDWRTSIAIARCRERLTRLRN